MSNNLGFVPRKDRAQSPSWGFSHFYKRRALGKRLNGAIIVPMPNYIARLLFLSDQTKRVCNLVRVTHKKMWKFEI